MKGLKTIIASGAAAAAVVLAAAPADAHHSFPATYQVDKSAKIEGKVVQFMFRNPHSFVHVMAPDDQGKMQRWAVEWSGGAALARDGVSATALKPGDTVIITGNPGRTVADHRMRMQAIERPADGWGWKGNVD